MSMMPSSRAEYAVCCCEAASNAAACVRTQQMQQAGAAAAARWKAGRKAGAGRGAAAGLLEHVLHCLLTYHVRIEGYIRCLLREECIYNSFTALNANRILHAPEYQLTVTFTEAAEGTYRRSSASAMRESFTATAYAAPRQFYR